MLTLLRREELSRYDSRSPPNIAATTNIARFGGEKGGKEAGRGGKTADMESGNVKSRGFSEGFKASLQFFPKDGITMLSMLTEE